MSKSKESYPFPEDVTSPRQRWSRITTILDGGPGGYSLAFGQWDKREEHPGYCLVARWNGNHESKGNPVSRGYPTWFVLPEVVALATLNKLHKKVTPEYVSAMLKAHSKKS